MIFLFLLFNWKNKYYYCQFKRQINKKSFLYDNNDNDIEHAPNEFILFKNEIDCLLKDFDKIKNNIWKIIFEIIYFKIFKFYF